MIHFIDCETSGLTDDDEIIQVAVATWDNGKVDLRCNLSFYCAGVISPEAQTVNKYDPMIWAKQRDAEWWSAKQAGVIADTIRDLVIWGGSNPGFDQGFLRRGFRRVRLEFPRIGHRKADIASMAVPLLVCGAIENVGLQALMTYFGLGVQQHDAVSDAMNSIKVFEALTGLYWKGFGPK